MTRTLIPGLVGHGAYGAALAKASWHSYFAVQGLSSALVYATDLLRMVGGAEISLGMLVLVFPIPSLLLLVAAWKIFRNSCDPWRAN